MGRRIQRWRVVHDRPELPVEDLPEAPVELRLRRRSNRLLWWAGVSGVVVVGLVLVVLQHWRRGVGLVGAGFLLAAVLVALLDTPRVGALAVRFRRLDVACYGGLGLLILTGAFIVPPPTPGG